MQFYSTSIPEDSTYDESVPKMKLFVTSEEKQAEMLWKWQSMKHLNEITKQKEKSEVEVFCSFSFKLPSVQRQLPVHYQHDSVLRDQIIISADSENIQQRL